MRTQPTEGVGAPVSAVQAVDSEVGPAPTPAQPAEPPVAAVPARPSRWQSGALKPTILGLSGVVGAIAAWALLLAAGILSQNSVPGPAAVAARMLDLIGDRSFLDAVATTLRAWAVSLLVAALVAVPVGLVVGQFSFIERPVMLVVDAARSVPSSALIPVAIILFGLGTEMKSSLVIYSVFWPLLVNSLYGSRGVDPVMKRVARSMRWGPVKILRKVVLPSAAPAIATGIRVAASIGLTVVLGAELLGATDGVGTVILQYQDIQRADFVYAGIVLIGLLGTAIAWLLTWFDRKILPWSVANRSRS